MLKVAFIDQTGDEVGGAEESLALLLSHLPADVVPIVVLFTDGAFAQRLRDAGLVVEIVPIAGIINGATRSGIPLGSLRVVPGAIAALTGILRRHEVNVVHTNTVKAHFLGAIAARLAGIACVVHLRDILSGMGRRALRAVILTCSSRRIAISQRVASCYSMAHMQVIANPLDLGMYDGLPDRTSARKLLVLPDDAPVFAVVGRVSRWKGHDKFLRAAASALRSTNARFSIIGEPRFADAGYLSELHELTERLGIGERVHFLPWQADMKTVYSAIDVLVNCSEGEPFGRTVIEAAAASIPTICFDDAGVAEFMLRGNVGSVVPAGDVSALAAAMVRLSDDPSMLAESGRAARYWAKDFDAGKHAGQVADVLRSAAKSA